MLLLRTIGAHVAMAVGLAYLARLLWNLVSIIYRHTAYHTDWAGKWGAGKDRWAVVTGATDGIGREYATQLAKKGYSVLLVGRSAAKLAEVAQEIQAGGGRAEELVVDFSHATEADFARVAAAVAAKEVRVLVNNVGVSYPFPEYLHLQTRATLDDLLAVNQASMIYMSKAVLGGMVELFRRSKVRNQQCSCVVQFCVTLLLLLLFQGALARLQCGLLLVPRRAAAGRVRGQQGLCVLLF